MSCPEHGTGGVSASRLFGIKFVPMPRNIFLSPVSCAVIVRSVVSVAGICSAGVSIMFIPFGATFLAVDVIVYHAMIPVVVAIAISMSAAIVLLIPLSVVFFSSFHLDSFFLFSF
jgi:hypothetical protein